MAWVSRRWRKFSRAGAAAEPSATRNPATPVYPTITQSEPSGTLPPLVATGGKSREPPGWVSWMGKDSHFALQCHGQMLGAAHNFRRSRCFRCFPTLGLRVVRAKKQRWLAVAVSSRRPMRGPVEGSCPVPHQPGSLTTGKSAG